MSLKLVLLNFGCWENKVFEFPSGLSLINGASGQGKSTILSAIYFALYGGRKKYQSYGKSGCKVELYIDNMTVIRSKGPNRLLLYYNEEVTNNKVELEDASAQEFIDMCFGKHFALTSYIKQKDLDTFLSLKPTAKLNFLEKLICPDITSIKEKNKQQIARYDMLKNSLSTALLSIKKLDYQEPIEVVFPLKIPKALLDKPLEDTIENEKKKYKNASIHIKTATSKLTESKLLLPAIYEAEKQYAVNLSMKKELEYKIDEISREANKYIINETELASLISKLSLLQVNRQYIQLTTEIKENTEQYNKLYKEEKESKELEISKLIAFPELTLEQANARVVLLKDLVEQTKLCDKYQSELSQIKIDYDLTDIDIDLSSVVIDIEQQRKVLSSITLSKSLLSCPHCSNKVRYNNNILVKESGILEYNGSYEDEKKRLDTLSKELSELTQLRYNIVNKLSKQDELKKKLAPLTANKEAYKELLELQNYINDNLIIKSKRELLEKKGWSTTLLSLQRSLADKEKILSKLPKIQIDDITETEEQIKEKISMLKGNKDKFVYYVKLLSETEDKLKSITINKPVKLSEEVNKDIQVLEEFISTKQTEFNTISNNLKKVDEYNLYLYKKKEYDRWKSELTRLTEEEKEASSIYIASLTLKSKILEAETLAISSLIQSINIHLQMYLDSFFPTNPITIELLNYKKTLKTEKPGISLSIGYKGESCSITDLSGGEYDRIQLAFVLAFSEIFSSPLLMLDESIASLDAETTEVVVKTLKSRARKYTLIVAHQIVAGQFDYRLDI